MIFLSLEWHQTQEQIFAKCPSLNQPEAQHTGQ